MMESRKLVWRETAFVAVGMAACVAVMLLIYALLGRFSGRVLLGGAVGGLLAILNFFFMAVGAMMAADKAEKQDVKGGNATIQKSMLLRYGALFLILFAFAKSGLCDVLAMVLPIAFVRPILSIGAFFRKEGDQAQ